ncbi:potassium/proton antiporter [Roseimaritima sediminicola]|uniref:potassium/proton antiporter n=1 Tax=Roseimaritima sediminicola TaxID=2662066 RepID=UPI0012984C64|nr:potassium/proton antiporter [Roseimaritima sediminicola]
MLSVESLILFTGVLLLLGIASNTFSTRMGVPVLFLFLVVGMLAGSEGVGGIEFEDYSLAYAIGTVALSIILFDGGLRTPLHTVRSVWKPAAVLATLGVVITAVITGLAASWILQISLLEGLLLGSIVGSTDASAVFSVLGSGGVNIRRKLADILELESGSNDPMAIFMTVGLIQVLTNSMPLGVGLAMLFVNQLVIGCVAGCAVGYGGVWVLRNVQLGAAGLYPVLATALALLAFGLAAILGGSGFLAVYLTGIVIGNQRPIFHRGILLFHDAAAWICQILMFMTLGLLSFPSRLLEASGVALLISAVLIFVARPIAVFLCGGMFRFSLREMSFLSLVGLKGAVPITLATFPMLAGLSGADQVFDTVFFVVLVSALIQGWPLPLVARLLKAEEPARFRPPVSLEISSLHNVDGDIVDYTVDASCPAAGRQIKELALPDGVVVALLVRGTEIIPPQGRTRVLVGDNVIVVLRPAVRALVDRVFTPRPADAIQLPAAVEFPLRGSIRVRDLEQFYGLRMNAAPDCTLEDFMRSQLPSQEVHPGALVHHNGLRFRVREIAARGTIEYVGMTFSAAPDPAAQTEAAEKTKPTEKTKAESGPAASTKSSKAPDAASDSPERPDSER